MILGMGASELVVILLVALVIFGPKNLPKLGKSFGLKKVGVMAEVPSIALMADQVAKVADFVSIGTNDLTQYTLATDRQGGNLDRFFDAHHPAVLRMIKMAADNAHKAGIWIGICGELGADISMTETFMALGVDELSVSPSAVLPLRSTIRSINTAENREKILEDLLR